MNPNGTIERVVFHHTAAWEHEADGSLKLPTVQSLHQLHVMEHGWSDVGYHLVVDRFGVVHGCRPIKFAPAAHRPHNTGSLAVCAIGWNGSEDFPAWEWTRVQILSLQEILDAARLMWGRDLEWLGHRDVEGASTLCPGVDVRELLR